MSRYSPAHIANFMLDQAENEGRAITQLKLQKLVYIAYGWGLALNDQLFDEPVLAWEHGPVIRSLYDEFKHCGRNPIEQRSIDIDLDTMEFVEPRIPEDDEKTNLVLQKVWDVYKAFSATGLRNKTHEPDTPWSTIWKAKGKNAEIPPELIREHFHQKIRQYLKNAA